MSATNHMQLGRLGGGGRHRHGLRGQCRQLRRRRQDRPADLQRADPARAPRGAGPLRDRRRGRAGQARLRHRRRQGRDQHQRAVGNGRRAAQCSNGVLEKTRGLVAGRHLRRGHALQAVARSPSVLQRQLPADHQLGARLPRAVEARLSQGRRADWRRWSTRTPGSPAATTACRNAEDPLKPEDPYPRVKALRDTMRAEGISDDVPIIMAGGVWYLARVGRLDRQSRARPDRLPVRHAAAADRGKPDPAGLEGPAAHARGRRHPAAPLLADRLLFSSAVRNPFLRNLEARCERQIALFDAWRRASTPCSSTSGVKGKNFWVTPQRPAARARLGRRRLHRRAQDARRHGDLRHAAEERAMIRKDQADCMGCLSHCGFSSWKDHDDYTTGRLADPRSFCIQKTLQDIAHGGDDRPEPDVRRPRRLPLQAGPVLFEQLHADGEAAGRPDPDGGLTSLPLPGRGERPQAQPSST